MWTKLIIAGCLITSVAFYLRLKEDTVESANTFTEKLDRAEQANNTPSNQVINTDFSQSAHDAKEHLTASTIPASVSAPNLIAPAVNTTRKKPTPEQIATLESLKSRLTEYGMTFDQILNSQEASTLPDELRAQLYQETVKLLNSGDIKAETFLQGYSAEGQ